MKEYIMQFETEKVGDEELFYHRKTICELIRCKDCKWYAPEHCNGFGDGSYVSEDGYCYNAERRENEIR